MDSLPPELLYALFFGAVLLFQYLMKRFGPQQQEQEQEQPPPLEESDPELPAREQAPAPVFRAAAAVDIRFAQSKAPGASPALAERRFSRRTLMGNRRDVQNAVVIAAILGPCRAFEPHEVR